jgi:hypothetical protein
MSDPAGQNERAVENELREILEPLDRQLARVTMLFPLALVTVAPTIFCLLWFVVDETGRRSLVLTGGACCALIALYLCWEILAARVARWRFDRRFPPGSPARALALQILMEMETPSKAEDTLRSALACSSPDRIVRHRKGTSEEPAPAAPEQSPPAGDAATAPRPGGYYDYIPLEPRSRDEARKKDHRV